MEAVGQLPESLRTEGRTALAHSSPTRRARGGGKGTGEGRPAGPLGWGDGLGMARWAQEKDVLCPGGAQALE